MTVDEIYKLGIAYLPEELQDNPDLRKFSVSWMNVALAETMEIENTIRKHYGEELLTEPPTVQTVNDEVPYHFKLTRIAFPYMIASEAFIDDDNDYRANLYRTMYQQRANEAMIFDPELIIDVY